MGVRNCHDAWPCDQRRRPGHGLALGAGLGLGRRYGGQGMSLAHAELALVQVRLEMRGHVADQRHVADGHHKGQQQQAETGARHHGTILMQFCRHAVGKVAFWHSILSEMCHITKGRLAII